MPAAGVAPLEYNGHDHAQCAIPRAIAARVAVQFQGEGMQTQSMGSKLVWVVMAALLLACLVMAVMLWQRSSATPTPGGQQALVYSAQDLQAAVAAASERAREQHTQQGEALAQAKQQQRQQALQAGEQGRQPLKADAVPAERPRGALMAMPSPQAMQSTQAVDVAPALEGADGLALLIRQGVLRRAGPGDLGAWIDRARQYGSLGRDAQERLSDRPVYVITGAMRIPDGLYGANSVIFLIDSRTPHPLGSLGHSMLLDRDTGGCSGATCSLLGAH